jgi:hypothetical protein
MRLGHSAPKATATRNRERERRRTARVGVRTAKTPAGFFAAAISSQSSSFLATLGSKIVSLQDTAAGFFAAAICPQSSSFLATLGFKLGSLRDASGARRPCKTPSRKP